MPPVLAVAPAWEPNPGVVVRPIITHRPGPAGRCRRGPGAALWARPTPPGGSS